MKKSDLFSACPALKDALAREPALEKTIEELIRRRLAGAIEKYLADASAGAVANFLRQVSFLDLDRVERHRQAPGRCPVEPLRPGQVKPVPLVTIEQQSTRRDADESRGLASLGRGEWASVAFAGGSGTRFFSRLHELEQALPLPNEVLRSRAFDPQEPKGVFPISPVGGLSFFEIILADALRAGVKTGRLPLVLLLTSRTTHDRTIAFLENHTAGGFPHDGWIAFEQAQVPRLDEDGDLIVADDSGRLCTTGDGHGGVYRALVNQRRDGHSLLDYLEQEGISQLVMHNVDNPAARPFCPARLGFHLDQKSLFTLSAVRKLDPQEKVGVLMELVESGRVEVVEYNVVDPEVAMATNPATGRLLHEAGNTNTNLVSLDAVRSDLEPTLYTGKQISARTGPVKSSSLEILNQHITRLLDPRRVFALEVNRGDFFIPTKNVTGPDSVETSTQMLSEAARRILSEAGARVSEDALLDLHPACGRTRAELERLGAGPGWCIGERARLFLCASSRGESDEALSDGKLTLEPESSLVVYASRPYGKIVMQGERRLVIDEKMKSRLRIGRDVTLKRGVRLLARIGPGATLRIPAGTSISRDLVVEVESGQEVQI